MNSDQDRHFLAAKDCPICTLGVNLPAGSPALAKVTTSNVQDGTFVYDVDCRVCGRYAIRASVTNAVFAIFVASSGEPHIELARRAWSYTLRKRSALGEYPTIHLTEEDRPENTPIPFAPVPSRLVDVTSWLARKQGDTGSHAVADMRFDWADAGATSSQDFRGLIDLLREEGVLRPLDEPNSNTKGELVRVRLSAKGWASLGSSRDPRLSRRAFVAMSYDKSLQSLYEDGISSAIAELGLIPVRLDREEHTEQVTDRILAEIRGAALVIADFTQQSPGVYFEAGFALALGVPVIWCVQEAEKDAVHFNTRQYNHIVWTDARDMRSKLVDRVRGAFPALCEARQ